MACCDANLCFTYVDIGAQGAFSDGGVFRHSAFGSNIIEHTVDVPHPTPLPNCEDTTPFPYYFIGDEAFPLRTNLLCPYSKRSIFGILQKVFNYRLSRARFTIENTFGLLAARWRIFHRVIHARNADTVINYIKATVVLHNYVMKTNPNANYRNDHCDEQGPNPFGNVQMFEGRNSTRESYRLRDIMARYLLSPAGALPYQVDHVMR
jgi:hypothetical protein